MVGSSPLSATLAATFLVGGGARAFWLWMCAPEGATALLLCVTDGTASEPARVQQKLHTMRTSVPQMQQHTKAPRKVIIPAQRRSTHMRAFKQWWRFCRGTVREQQRSPAAMLDPLARPKTPIRSRISLPVPEPSRARIGASLIASTDATPPEFVGGGGSDEACGINVTCFTGSDG